MRFGVAGGSVTALSLAIYWLCAVQIGLAPLLSNAIAYTLSMGVGYLLHSRWTFGDKVQTGAAHYRIARFLVSNLVGFSLNSFWVWSMTVLLHWPAWSPMPLMGIVTPLLIFAISRAWVFR